MTLSDGRKIVPYGDSRAKQPNTVEVHPDFRIIVLANRPGFPFLGNDFFGALGKNKLLYFCINYYYYLLYCIKTYKIF